jgi:hypothetical protein
MTLSPIKIYKYVISDAMETLSTLSGCKVNPNYCQFHLHSYVKFLMLVSMKFVRDTTMPMKFANWQIGSWRLVPDTHNTNAWGWSQTPTSSSFQAISVFSFSSCLYNNIHKLSSHPTIVSPNALNTNSTELDQNCRLQNKKGPPPVPLKSL